MTCLPIQFGAVLRFCALLLVVSLTAELPRGASAKGLPEGVPSSAVMAIVSEHIDGDKIKVGVRSVEEEVLLIGVDAPEPGECFAEEAADRVAELTPVGTTVYLEAGDNDRDDKDRLLRWLWVPGEDGEKAYLLNTKLVREGYGGFDPMDDNDKYDERLEVAEESAREKDAGLWGACGALHAQMPEAPEVSEPPRCIEVDPELVEAIETALVGGTSLRAARAVQSEDFVKVYMVAAEIEGPGMDGDDHIGVWATNSLEAGGGIILAVDGFAQEFSDWADADSTDAGITRFDDGVAEARECVEYVLDS